MVVWFVRQMKDIAYYIAVPFIIASRLCSMVQTRFNTFSLSCVVVNIRRGSYVKSLVTFSLF